MLTIGHANNNTVSTATALDSSHRSRYNQETAATAHLPKNHGPRRSWPRGESRLVCTWTTTQNSVVFRSPTPPNGEDSPPCRTSPLGPANGRKSGKTTAPCPSCRCRHGCCWTGESPPHHRRRGLEWYNRAGESRLCTLVPCFFEWEVDWVQGSGGQWDEELLEWCCVSNWGGWWVRRREVVANGTRNCWNGVQQTKILRGGTWNIVILFILVAKTLLLAPS